MSKNFCYENPYNVTGIIKIVGWWETPNKICKDKNIGTKKVTDIET
jgi:hypothetical protein